MCLHSYTHIHRYTNAYKDPQMEALASIEIKLWFINTNTILLICMENRFFVISQAFFLSFFFS